MEENLVGRIATEVANGVVPIDITKNHPRMCPVTGPALTWPDGDASLAPRSY